MITSHTEKVQTYESGNTDQRPLQRHCRTARHEARALKTTAVRALPAVLGGDVRVIELPLNASEDRVVGTLRLGTLMKTGEREFVPGLLAEANGQILYVDEINLLEDTIVDLLLDAAASGVCRVEREGVSLRFPARFVLVGTMNPEEGSLRPQLLELRPLRSDQRGSEPGRAPDADSQAQRV